MQLHFSHRRYQSCQKIGQQVDGFADTVGGFGSWCSIRVTNGVSHGELLDNVSQGGLIMMVVILVLLEMSAKGFVEVASLFMEGGLMNVGKQVCSRWHQS